MQKTLDAFLIMLWAGSFNAQTVFMPCCWPTFVVWLRDCSPPCYRPFLARFGLIWSDGVRYVCLNVQAKEHGFGMVGTFNTCTSTGSIGVYARKLADEGLIAFCFAQSPEARWTIVAVFLMHGSIKKIQVLGASFWLSSVLFSLVCFFNALLCLPTLFVFGVWTLLLFFYISSLQAARVRWAWVVSFGCYKLRVRYLGYFLAVW